MKSMTKISHTLKASIVAGASLVALAQAGAQAGDTKAFNIPAGDLKAALDAYIQQSGQELIYRVDQVKGVPTQGLSGAYSVEDALSQMLDGSAFKMQRDPSGAIVVVRLSSADMGMQAGEGNTADSPDTANAFVLEEIVVTATRREASMQDIPMSIAAFSGDRIQKSGIHDIVDLEALAAGLHIEMINGQANVSLRGINAQQTSVGAESGVAVHQDSVYIVQRPDIALGFFDVDRVEVLRGPQGTLYGRNATGGAINIISRAPTEDFEAGGRVSFGNYSLVETEGYVSGPLIGDKLMARVAFKTRDHNGYTPNLFDGKAQDNGDYAGVRGLIRYEPTSDIRVDLKLDFARDNSQPALIHARRAPDVPLLVETLGSVLPDDPRVMNQDGPYLNVKESWGVSAKVEWNVSDMVLSSLTSYRKFDWHESLDWDGGDVRVGYFGQEHRDTWSFTQELTLSSTGDSKLEWIVGAYYFHAFEKQNGTTGVPYIDYFSNFITDDYTTDAYAAFGEASYPIIESLTLTLGARYSREEKSIRGRSILTFGGIEYPAALHNPEDGSWDNFSPKVALTYDLTDDVAAYVTVSKGFKGGGYNGYSEISNPEGPYGPERVTNYEAGLKGAFWEDRLRANIAVFHMAYTDMQQFVTRPSTRIPGSFSTAVQNAAAATIRGVELDMDAVPTERLSLNFNLSYLDATYKDFPDALLFGVATDVSGNQLSNTPKWAANAGASYAVPVGDWGSVTLRGEWSYKSQVSFTPFHRDVTLEDGYHLFNARLTFEEADGRWTIAGWVKNIGDTLAATRIEETAGTYGAVRYTYIPPRTYGITLGYKF